MSILRCLYLKQFSVIILVCLYGYIYIYICIKIFIRGEPWPTLRSDYLLEVELTVSHNRSRNFWNDISAL